MLYEVVVKVWDEYVIEVEADNREEAEEYAVENCENESSIDGGRDVEEVRIITKNRIIRLGNSKDYEDYKFLLEEEENEENENEEDEE